LWPPNYLDSADVVISEIGEIERAGEPLIELNSVQQNLSLIAAVATDEDGSHLAGRSGLHYVDSGYRLESIRDKTILMQVDI